MNENSSFIWHNVDGSRYLYLFFPLFLSFYLLFLRCNFRWHCFNQSHSFVVTAAMAFVSLTVANILFFGEIVFVLFFSPSLSVCFCWMKRVHIGRPQIVAVHCVPKCDFLKAQIKSNDANKKKKKNNDFHTPNEFRLFELSVDAQIAIVIRYKTHGRQKKEQKTKIIWALFIFV